MRAFRTLRPAVVAPAALLVLAAMATSPRSAPSSPEDLNRLNAREQADGWQLLFDGESLERWRGFRMDGLPAGWTVEEGKIHFLPPSEGQRADLVTREQYADFELKLEWAVTPGGNSGIMFRVGEDKPRTYHTGPEMQILDDRGHPDGKRPETSAGSNYALHAPSREVVRPVGEFNEVFLRVAGDHVEQFLNGIKLVDYRLWTDDWKQKVQASKFASMPSYGLNKTGHIALQDHGDELWFRNLKIRPLP